MAAGTHVRIDQLNVVLRARSSWEAMELGSALVRRQPRAVWGAWLLASLPVFVVANALAWWRGDGFGLAWLLLWWCTPCFERVVLYVLSRDVFGEPVGAWQALRAQRHWGGNGFWGYLGWRRFSPLRNVCLPVNLLEDAPAGKRAQRRRAVLAAAAGPALLLTLACMAFQLVLVLGAIAAVFLFMPPELLSDSWRAASAWALFDTATPAWAKLVANLLWWMAGSVIGPFHIGAGFGLYLDRRTQMEAWDAEIAFRGLRGRLQRTAPLLGVLLGLTLPLLPGDGHAQGAGPDQDTPAAVFGEAPVDTAGFRQAVQRAYEDPLQRPTRTVTSWQRRDDDAAANGRQDAATRGREAARRAPPRWAGNAARLMATVAEAGLWLLLAVLLAALLLTARRWLPWLRGSGRRAAPAAGGVSEADIPRPPTVPADVATRARGLWDQGMARQALALLYRASVVTVGERSGVALAPGATEAQVLRVSRRMPDAEDRDLFVAIVRMWQYAAYGNQLPARAEFEQLAERLQARYRWPA